MAGYTDSVGCDVGWYWLASDCWSWNAGWHRIHHVVVHRQSRLRRGTRARDSEGGYSGGFGCLRYRGRDCSRETALACLCFTSHRQRTLNLTSVTPMAENPAQSPRKKWIEPVVAVLMALTTICTAWCSYESATWTRQSNRLMNESNALEQRAALLEVQGNQALIVHTAMFMELLAAQYAGNEKLASFYAERFPPDVKKAYEAWLAQKPFENRAADAHPFVPNLYQVRGATEAAAARAEAVRRIVEARDAGNRSGQYLANTVLFATVLFFAGTAGKFEAPRVRLYSAAFGVAVFVFAVVRMLLMPAA